MPAIDEHGEAVQSPDDIAYARAAADAFADIPAVEHNPLEALGTELMGEFTRAMGSRLLVEQRWLKDLRQFKGVYEPEELTKMDGRSKTFIRKTRVKVKTADSRMMDLIFPNGTERNWTIEPTPIPTLPEDVMSALQEQAAAVAKQTGQSPTEALQTLVSEKAAKAAQKMTKTVEDQLAETRYKAECKKTLHSGNLYGTGILKGPLLERRVRSSYAPVKNGRRLEWKTKTVQYVSPTVKHVPLFNFYPDMSAVELVGCRFVYELHTMTQADMTALSKRPTFRKDLIQAYISANPKGRAIVRNTEQEKRSVAGLVFDPRDTYQWDVLERSGWLSGEQLRNAGVNVPDDRLTEVFFSNLWLLPDGQIIKARLSKLDGEADWPYRIYYFEKDDDSIFGNGLAEIMRDDQTAINAGVRMMMDNGAFAAGPQFEVDVNLLATGEQINNPGPWKVWRRKPMAGTGQNTGQAVRMIQPSSNLDGLGRIVSMFDTNADETTAFPRYMSGENVTRGAGGTASGMSMLMAAANVVLRDLLISWDDGISEPTIEGFYNWNMRYNPDADIKGDFNTKARGASSLIAKEVRGQQLQAFLQQTDNPQDGIYVNRRKALREWANCIEMNDVMYSDDEVERNANSPQAKTMAELQQQQQALAMQQAQAQVQKLIAEAERAKAAANQAEANIQLTIEKAVETRVNQMYASAQAGQTLLSQPGVAVAADHVFRAAGGSDQHAKQAEQQQEMGMDMLESSLAPDGAQPPGDGQQTGTNRPEPANPAQATPPQAAPEAASAQVGRNAGIQTAREDGQA